MRAAGFAIHPFTRRAAPPLVVVLVAAACSGIAGCDRAAPEAAAAAAERLDGPPEKMELAWEEGEIPGAPRPTPVLIKEGVAPLLYLSERAATLRVVDRSSDEVLAEAAVGPRTIVRVDTRSGIVVGGRTLVAGPLPDRRRYAIYMVPRGGNVSRSGVSQPAKGGEPGNEAGKTSVPEER